MKIKVVMNSGKEYVLSENNYVLNDFTCSFYSELPNGSKMLKNILVNLDRDDKIVINPTHISSIEIIEK